MQLPYQAQNIPIVKQGGLMQEPFRLFINDVAKLGVIVGTGTPEGTVAAEQGQQYMDDTGTAGAIMYVKRDADIAGDITKGWILI